MGVNVFISLCSIINWMESIFSHKCVDEYCLINSLSTHAFICMKVSKITGSLFALCLIVY